jgi:HAE1 family hydrophobic/amphiphilic exporter-1
MKSFGLTMAFAVMVSLLVSFTLTPMLGARWLKLRRAEGDDAHPAHTSRESAWFGPLDRGYTKALDWALSHRRVVAIIAFLVLLSSAPLFMLVNKNFLPSASRVQGPARARPAQSTSSSRIATRGCEGLSGVAFTMVTVADDSARTENAATIYVRGPSRRAGRVRRVRPSGTFEPMRLGLRTAVRPSRRWAGRAAEARDQFVLNSPDREAPGLRAGRRRTRCQRGRVDIRGSRSQAGALDRAKAADLGVQIGDAAEAIRLLVGGDQVTTYNEGGEQYEVHLRALPGYRRTASDVGSLTVPSSRLGSVSLDNIASFAPGTAPAEIQRLNRARQVTVYAGLLPGVGQTSVMDAMQARVRLTGGPPVAGRSRGSAAQAGPSAGVGCRWSSCSSGSPVQS